MGLQHAFEKGLIHRDIKPSNLLLTADGATVKLLDLGLARLQGVDAGPTSQDLTETGTVVGSPDYIAPEQARNAKDVDIRADLYSLGCTMYFLLTGRSPFTGETLTEKLLKHQLDEAQPVEQLRPEVPASLAAIVRRLMAKKPQDRCQTPAELVDALAAFLPEGTGETSRSAPGMQRKASLPLTVPMAAEPLHETVYSAPTATAWQSPVLQRKGRGRVWLLIGAGVGFLGLSLVLAVGAAWYSRTGSTAVGVVSKPSPSTRAVSSEDQKQALRHFERGRAYLGDKKYGQAIDELDRAIRLNPQMPGYFIVRGSAFMARGDQDAAIADFDRALQIDRNSASAYFLRASAYYNKGAYARCVADNTEAIRLQPKDATAYSNRGTAYQFLAEPQKALADFTQAIELDPRHASAYANRGGVYVEMKQYDRAILDLDEALRLDPNASASSHNRGVAHYHKRNYEQAIADLNRAIQLHPKYAMAYFIRGQAHAKQGNQVQADADYRKAIELDPSIAKLKKD